VVTVKPPQGHDAKVVKCSSCGGPQEEGRTSCNFCGADFTLHERDLNTVCPKCTARISDRAKFCHHCGNRVAVESVAGEETGLVCPACGEPHHLVGRRVADVPVLECGCCAGLWLSGEVFEQLTEQAAAETVDANEHFPPRQAGPGDPALAPRQGQRYRKCPKCGQIMHRRNYARRSGVIIDVCRQHGVWFDAEELRRILLWVRSGGLAKAERDVAEEKARQERYQGASADQAKRRAAMWTDAEPDRRNFGLAAVLVETAFWLLRR